jgi:hypothetical protein
MLDTTVKNPGKWMAGKKGGELRDKLQALINSDNPDASFTYKIKSKVSATKSTISSTRTKMFGSEIKLRMAIDEQDPTMLRVWKRAV